MKTLAKKDFIYLIAIAILIVYGGVQTANNNALKRLENKYQTKISNLRQEIGDKSEIIREQEERVEGTQQRFDSLVAEFKRPIIINRTRNEKNKRTIDTLGVSNILRAFANRYGNQVDSTSTD